MDRFPSGSPVVMSSGAMMVSSVALRSGGSRLIGKGIDQILPVRFLWAHSTPWGLWWNKLGSTFINWISSYLFLSERAEIEAAWPKEPVYGLWAREIFAWAFLGKPVSPSFPMTLCCTRSTWFIVVGCTKKVNLIQETCFKSFASGKMKCIFSSVVSEQHCSEEGNNQKPQWEEMEH